MFQKDYAACNCSQPPCFTKEFDVQMTYAKYPADNIIRQIKVKNLHIFF